MENFRTQTWPAICIISLLISFVLRPPAEPLCGEAFLGFLCFSTVVLRIYNISLLYDELFYDKARL